MWELYTYEVATTSHDDQWERHALREKAFTRHPNDIARGLLEQWINDNHGRLPGGRVFVYSRPADNDPTEIVATVRIRVWKGGLTERGERPVAAAYLGHAVRDIPRWLHLGRHWIPRPRRREPVLGSPALDDIDLVDDDGTGAYPDWVPARSTAGGRTRVPA